MVLHRLGAPGIHWRHVSPRHENVHVVVILLRRRRRRSRFGSRNHRFGGGLVPTSSSHRGGTHRGRPGSFAPGLLSGTACGLLLLLLGGQAVVLAMNAFPRPALLALGAVPLLVTLLATSKALVVLVPTVPLCFHPSGLGTLACVVFASSIALQLGPHSSHRSSVTLLFRLPACSIVGFKHILVPSLLVYDVEQCVGVMHYEIVPHLLFHLPAQLDWLYCRCYRLYLHLGMLQRVLPTTGLHQSVSPLSARYFRRACFCMNTLLSTGTLASIFSTRKIWRKIHITRLLDINASKVFEPFL